ncbi:MAG: type II secretion system F family protein [Candidatus Woesearchaeota archaeon]
MPNDILEYTKKILELSEEIKLHENEGDLEKHKDLLKKINVAAKDLQFIIENDKVEKKKVSTSKEEKGKYLKELRLTKEEVKKFAKDIKKPKKEEEIKSHIYKTNFYAKLANYFLENISFKLIRKNPENFKSLFYDIRAAGIRILSETYLSIILFSTIIAFPLALIITFFASSFNILLAFGIGILASIVTFAFTWSYPNLAKTERSKKIKEELVFAIVHMAAVAGSGAHPIKIFELLVDSHEYQTIERELQRVLNYINLFGYSLSTSLRAVANTTPSDEFKELLHGMSSTIETGGDIKDYLQEKSKDALMQFKFDQKKKLEALATYSDIYTGILIAGPLLFIVTLAILEKISPELGGISIGLIANLSVFLALPLLNIFYILFLQSVRSEI